MVVAGYYGFGNVGDEAVLAGIVRMFQGSGCELTAISADPSQTTSLHGIPAISRGDVRGVLKTIGSADAFLSGGGSLFQDATSARSALYYLTQFWYAASVARRPSIVFAQGIGPLRRKWIRGPARRVLDKAALITLRDEQSRDLLQEIGVRRPPIEVTADPSFVLPVIGRDEGRRLLRDLGVPGDEVVISICVRPWGDVQWAAVLAGALASFVREIGGRALLLALHPGMDLRPARALAQAIPGAVVADRLSTFEDVRAAIAGSDMVISMRLHGLMFAVREGAPSVGVSYDPKVEAFCRSCGLPYVSVGDLAPDVLLACAGLAWEDRNRLAACAAERSKELEQAAFRNAELVLEPTPGSRQYGRT